MKKLNVIGKCLMLVIASFSSKQLYAQLAPFGAMYYQNQYINNPAYAGLNEGLEFDGGIRIQDNNLPGAPKTQFLTGKYSLNGKAGIGLNLNTEQVGLIKKVRTVASYAYHLPLNAENNKISFGLSLGFTDESVDFRMLSGEQNDAMLGNFNQRETYIDGDFGMLYQYKNLNFEGALLNISQLLRDKNEMNASSANVAKYYFAGSYKIPLSTKNTDVVFEPKLAYRVIQGFDDIIDVGTNIRLMDQKLSVFGIYHSSQSTTIGLGARLIDNLNMNLMYTSATAVLATESSGSFEVNLKFRILKTKK